MSSKEKVKETTEEVKETTPEDRPKCPYCAQPTDEEALKKSGIKDVLPIPAGQWKLLNKIRAEIDDVQADLADIQLGISDKINEFSKTRKLVYMIGLGVDPNPPKKDEEDHQWEMFISRDPTSATPIRDYLGIKLNDKEQDILKELYWNMGDQHKKLGELNRKYNKKMTKIARTCGWWKSPVVIDGKGNFVTQDWVQDQIKNAEERGKDKAKKEFEKKK